MKTRLVIFDLDGTLLNTIGDLAVSTNHMLALRGLKQHTYEEYCHFVGNGIKIAVALNRRQAHLVLFALRHVIRPCQAAKTFIPRKTRGFSHGFESLA